jgi:hypothetical protein
MKTSFLLLLSLLLVSCTPGAPSTMQIVDVYSTAAAQPWLEEMYLCAQDASVALNVTTDAPQIQLRLGQLDGWTGPVFQVGTEEIVVAANLQSLLGNLTQDQVKAIFAGQGDASTQVWAYASAEDIQRAFEQAVMNGRSVTSFARLAVNPAHMSEVLSADVNAIGFLPRRWMTSGLRELLIAATVPVLALTPSEPEGLLRDLIACMQK